MQQGGEPPPRRHRRPQGALCVLLLYTVVHLFFVAFSVRRCTMSPLMHCHPLSQPLLPHMQGILVVHESMARLNTFSVPYPFICILHISVFLFVYR